MLKLCQELYNEWNECEWEWISNIKMPNTLCTLTCNRFALWGIEFSVCFRTKELTDGKWFLLIFQSFSRSVWMRVMKYASWEKAGMKMTTFPVAMSHPTVALSYYLLPTFLCIIYIFFSFVFLFFVRFFFSFARKSAQFRAMFISLTWLTCCLQIRDNFCANASLLNCRVQKYV